MYIQRSFYMHRGQCCLRAGEQGQGTQILELPLRVPDTVRNRQVDLRRNTCWDSKVLFLDKYPGLSTSYKFFGCLQEHPKMSMLEDYWPGLPFSNLFSQLIPPLRSIRKSKNTAFMKFSWSMSYPSSPQQKHNWMWTFFLLKLHVRILFKRFFFIGHGEGMNFILSLHIYIVNYIRARSILTFCGPELLSMLFSTCQVLI